MSDFRVFRSHSLQATKDFDFSLSQYYARTKLLPLKKEGELFRKKLLQKAQHSFQNEGWEGKRVFGILLQIHPNLGKEMSLKLMTHSDSCTT